MVKFYSTTITFVGISNELCFSRKKVPVNRGTLIRIGQRIRATDIITHELIQTRLFRMVMLVNANVHLRQPLQRNA